MAGTPRFVSCTPFGVQQLLVRTGVEIAGKHVVVVGRSVLVGRPLSVLLSNKAPNANATVTVCHTRDEGPRRGSRVKPTSSSPPPEAPG